MNNSGGMHVVKDNHQWDEALHQVRGCALMTKVLITTRIQLPSETIPHTPAIPCC